MAEVDFSNARIEPVSTLTNNLWTVSNATKNPNVSMQYGTTLYDSNVSSIGSGTCTRLINQQKQLMYIFQGTFNTSGTELYVLYTVQSASSKDASGWKISNISFSSGDTYVFQINATLVCN